MAAVDSFELLYRELRSVARPYWEFLAVLGALYAGRRVALLVGDAFTLLRVHLLPRILPPRNLKHRYGGWAVVCGAVQPVARAYAEELARQGISLILVSPDRAAVTEAATFLAHNYRVEAVVAVADFSLDPVASKPVSEALRGRDVGILVTCVDEALTAPRGLLDTPPQHLLDVLNQNMAAATVMARLVLPGMLERGRGAVVNISSGLRCTPPAGRTMLAACTGYVEEFSTALQREFSSRGIFVQSLRPLQVASSRLRPSPREGWFVPKPEVYAKHAVSTLGVSQRTSGYWPHTLQSGLMRCVPEWIWVLGSRVFISHS